MPDSITPTTTDDIGGAALAYLVRHQDDNDGEPNTCLRVGVIGLIGTTLLIGLLLALAAVLI